MKQEYYIDLALAYVQGRLTPEEKLEVFKLIQDDAEFRDILLLELELVKSLSGFKAASPRTIKVRTYRMASAAKTLSLVSNPADAVLTPIITASLPMLASQILINYQRRVAYNEWFTFPQRNC